jgi:3-oxoadipate enol-lactonase
MQTRTIEVNGISTSYEMVGEGPPIVFVHGWSYDKSVWRQHAEVFSKRYRVLAYDWRGMGGSSGGTTPYPLQALVDDLAALLEALDVRRPILCGHSLGGAIVLTYAIQHPENTAQLVLVDSNFPSSLLAKLQLSVSALGIAAGIGIPSVRRALNTMEILWDVCKLVFYSASFRKSHPEVIAAQRGPFLENSPEALVCAFNTWLRRPKSSSELDRVSCPTLLVYGSADAQVPQAQMRYVEAGIAGSRWLTIEGAGHTSMQEQPDFFNEKVLEILAGASLSPSG